MTKTKQQSSGGFMVTIVFILSIIILVLLFVIFMRDKSSDTALTSLAQSNNQLTEAQKKESEKTIEQRLKDAGFDTGNLWVKAKCEEPYCGFVSAFAKDGEQTPSRAIERWEGYFTQYKDEGGECTAFIRADGVTRGIDMKFLSGLEQKLLKESTKKELVGLTVFTLDDSAPKHVCEASPFVLNVNF